MKKTGVYEIRCTANGKVYVGSAAVSIADRWKHHKTGLRYSRHENRYLQAAWNKHGEASFEFIVLEECQPAECIKREQFWIDEKKSADPNFGYNLSPAAGSLLGYKHDEEFGRKVSERNRGRKLSPESLAEIAAKLRGVPLSQDHRDAISRGSKGVPKTQEHNKKVSLAKSGKKRAPFSEAWRKAMSEAGKGRPQSPEHVRKRIESRLRTLALRRAARPTFSFMEDSE